MVLMRLTIRFALVLVSALMPFSVAAADAWKLDLRLWAQGFVSPVVFAPIPGPVGAGHYALVDQVGTIQVLDDDGKIGPRPFLDLRSRMVELNDGFDERGLLGLAFHPRFADNGKCYVYYSAPRRVGAPSDWDHTSHVSEFRVLAEDPLQADAGSERVVMEIDQPYFNHNGGCLAFGPDGLLYIAVGDGGNAHDRGRRPEHGNGQELMTVLGKILRIDVDRGVPYAIPPGNPFPDGADGRPEIYAWGLRNPWRMAFDRGAERRLFAADVGQGRYEEVNIIVKGANYGWNLLEGFEGFNVAEPNRGLAAAPRQGLRGEPLVAPIIAYKNFNGFRNDPEALGISVTGGFVYRGSAIPELQGQYVFGDWSRNWGRPEGVLFRALLLPKEQEGQTWTLEPLELASHPEGHMGAYVTAFGEDEEGELYVLTNGGNTPTGRTGRVWKLVPTEARGL